MISRSSQLSRASVSSSGCSRGLPGAPLRLLRPVPVTPWITWDKQLTYQEEHALLEPLPGELAEAAQANEFLQRKQTLSWLGACKPAATQILASSHHAPFHTKNHGDHSSCLLRAKLPLSSSPCQEPARQGWTFGFSNREETITHRFNGCPWWGWFTPRPVIMHLTPRPPRLPTVSEGTRTQPDTKWQQGTGRQISLTQEY